MKNCFLSLALLFSAISAIAQEKLKVGDVAPNITVTDWVGNEPKDKNFSLKFVVLEFWATWCGPCLEAVPHLNDLQEKFQNRKDLVFVSVTDEKPENVQKMLQRIKMNSIVVCDQNKKTQKDFTVEYKGNMAIPVTILIDNKGFIQFIGQPSDLNEEVISDLLNGKKIAKASEKRLDPEERNARIVTMKSDPIVMRAMGLIRNNDSTQVFELTETDFRKPKGMKMSIASPKIGLYTDTYADLGALLGKLLSAPSSYIVLPDALKNKNYSLIYKNPAIQNEDSLKSDILKRVCADLKINFKAVKQTSTVYFLSLVDSAKLEISKIAATDGKEMTNMSDAGDKVVFTNCPINMVVSKLEEKLKIKLFDYTGIVQKCNYLISNKSVAEMIKSFESYGISVKPEQQEITHFFFEQK